MIRAFKKPPIKEAMIDIHAVLPPEVGHDVLERLHAEIEDAYPEKIPQWRGSVKFESKDGKPRVMTPVEDVIGGYVFRSADEKQVVQYRLDGFALSRLEPYEDWERFRDEAVRLWEIYAAEVEPSRLLRRGIRTINAIRIDKTSFQLQEYLTAPPQIPPDLGVETLEGFDTRVVLRFDGGIKASIVQAIMPGPPSSTTIILDIDVFLEEEVSRVDSGIWEPFESFREIKDTIFVKSLSDDLIRTFDE